jgi:hypothetical protein
MVVFSEEPDGRYIPSKCTIQGEMAAVIRPPNGREQEQRPEIFNEK